MCEIQGTGTIRVVDLVHFWLDPNLANQNPTCTNLERIQTSQLFSYQSDFFRYVYVDFFT